MSVDQIPIGKFSFMTRLSQKALRLYDSKGLLVPEAKDPFTGYRYYTVSQLEHGMKIKALSFLGFSLEETAMLLDAEDMRNCEVIEACFKKRLEEVRLEIGQLQKIEGILQGSCKSDGKVMEIFKMSVTEPVIKEVPEMRVISKREKGIYAVTIGKLIGEICACISSPENQRNRVKVTGPVMFICHDEEYKETDADIEVALPVSGRVSVEDPKMEIKTLPAIKAISVVYRGPYQGVEAGYSSIFAYAAKNNLEPSGSFDPGRELYLNDPAEVPEEELMTEVQIPVREK
ncbi:MAG: MerR family transcriptional regulator [Methanosarcina sp.]|uniref:MerR family transcriptional regulator n=1 Tax=Methanosarcina sp. TaxID=2213 RepID=UPI002620AB7A|nr:MerR family transcriptional regulator [Methanosarcina sp.]MDD3248418.1 MerR family transcriptional regulator [Methanosarcina sp.]MDD4248063.1 MerR family transcriptional regulator [Methanosarcina sp.]